MVASRNMYNMKRYKRRRSGFEAFKYFIIEKKFLLIIIAAAVVVVVLFFVPGILTNQSMEDDTAVVQSDMPAVETEEPAPTPTMAAATPSATATPEPSTSPSASASAPRTLKYTKPNMQGDDVWALQEKLGLKPDGYYGEGTADAVREFQQNNGLPADGIAGPSTLQKLGLVK